MNRRLMIRCGFACAGLCLAAWRLPGLLDGALTKIDQHKGTIALLSGGGHSVLGGSSGKPQPADEVALLGAAKSLTPAERARLLEAAKRNDPLAQAQARIAARIPVKGAAKAPEPKPAPTAGLEGLDPSLTAALRALGMDPASMDLSSVDIDALLAKVREGSPD